MKEEKMVKKSRDVDGGWAWVVLFATVSYIFIHVGSLRSFGVLHIELMELFGEGDMKTGLVSFTLNLVATCVALPAGMLADRYSPRIIVMVGAVFAAIGIGATAFAPNLDVAIVTMGAITGAGIEFVAVTCIITLNKYFDKHRALANGIAMAGASLGNLVIPPILELIVQEYSFRGTILILGGVWANLLVVGAVLRPIEIEPEITDQGGMKLTRSSKQVSLIDITRPRRGSLFRTSHGNISIFEQVDDDGQRSVLDGRVLGTLFHSSHVIMGSCQSLAVMAGEEETQEQSPQDIKSINEENKERGQLCSLLMNPSIIQVGVMVAMGCMAIFTGLYTLPLLAHEIGESKFHGSLLLSIAGGCDLLSRIVLGLVSDFPQVSKPMVVKMSFLLCGALGLVLCSFYDFISLGILSVVLGILGSNHMLLLGPILIDIVGQENLGAAMGLVSIPMGLATAIGPPLLGAVKEATGTYYAAARLLSISFLIGFAVYFVDKDLIHLFKTRFCGKSEEKEIPVEEPETEKDTRNHIVLNAIPEKAIFEL